MAEEFTLSNCVSSRVLLRKLAASSFAPCVFRGHPEARVMSACRSHQAPTQQRKMLQTYKGHILGGLAMPTGGKSTAPHFHIRSWVIWLMGPLSSVRAIDFGRSCLLRLEYQATCVACCLGRRQHGLLHGNPVAEASLREWNTMLQCKWKQRNMPPAGKPARSPARLKHIWVLNSFRKGPRPRSRSSHSLESLRGSLFQRVSTQRERRECALFFVVLKERSSCGISVCGVWCWSLIGAQSTGNF